MSCAIMYRNQLSPTCGLLSAMHLNLCSRELRICPVSHLSMWGLFPLPTVPQSVVNLSDTRTSVTGRGDMQLPQRRLPLAAVVRCLHVKEGGVVVP